MKGGVGVWAAGCAAPSSSMIFGWWLWWARSALVLGWGLHWLISVGILGKPLGKCCNAENTGIESLHPDGKWLKELFAFAAAVVLTPFEWNQSQGSQSPVLLLLVCSEAKKATRKTLLPIQLSLSTLGFYWQSFKSVQNNVRAQVVQEKYHNLQKRSVWIQNSDRSIPHMPMRPSYVQKCWWLASLIWNQKLIIMDVNTRTGWAFPQTYFWEEMTWVMCIGNKSQSIFWNVCRFIYLKANKIDQEVS